MFRSSPPVAQEEPGVNTSSETPSSTPSVSELAAPVLDDSKELEPFPSLPVELVKRILSHCDRRTLASVCLGSWAVLSLAAPLLYRRIGFIDLDHFKTLLSSPAVSDSALEGIAQ